MNEWMAWKVKENYDLGSFIPLRLIIFNSHSQLIKASAHNAHTYMCVYIWIYIICIYIFFFSPAAYLHLNIYVLSAFKILQLVMFLKFMFYVQWPNKVLQHMKEFKTNFLTKILLFPYFYNTNHNVTSFFFFFNTKKYIQRFLCSSLWCNRTTLKH